MKILVADDSQPIRSRLVERLSSLPGVTVAEAEDTPQAIRQIATFMPDVAVLDIRMPGGGGIKALSEIKAIKPDTAVIIMTNYPYAQYRRKCLDAGADFFFDKSTEFELVTETIRQLRENGAVSEVAHRTAAAQLVTAKEELEKVTQRQIDMSILSLLCKSSEQGSSRSAYDMWEKTFDAMPDLVSIFDANQTIVRVNKAMADRLGVPAAELTGKKCFECCHGTDHPVSGCPHKEMQKDHKEHSSEFYEERLGGWFQVTVSPIYEGKRLIGAIHIAHDITARRKAAELVKASEVRYRRLFESMQSGFALHEMICDANGIPCDYRFLEVNPAFEKLTGLKAENIIGKTVKEVLPSTEDHWIKTYGNVALIGEPMRIEDFSAELGRYYSVAAYSPRKGQFATVISDVTEQKNSEESVNQALKAAEEANHVKTQFLANMSHELRTPLNAIIGLTELLSDSKLDNEQRDYIQTIGASGEALLTIIADLLDFSKIEMGKLTIKSEKFSIREVVRKSVALLTAFADTKGLKLSFDVASDIPETTTGDADRLQQILVNLLNNALKFTEEGFVKLTVHGWIAPSESLHLEFCVKDSGVGMDEATMKRIFQPFQQGDNSNTREHGGTGLGLAISKNLVEMMGGTVRVESRPGQGSCFSFYLKDPHIPQIPAPFREIRDKWRGKFVCVWTDDLSDMRTAEVFLEHCGIMPRYAETLDAIYRRLSNETVPDAVLCNLDMPGIMEKILEFRKIRPDVPWVAFSHWDIPLDEHIKGCFSAFIDRPLQQEQLHAILSELEEHV
jgi:PAS domain S-box-containing protein